MQDPWLPVLKKLNLSRAELAAVKRYEHDPGGRSFLPVADILRSHKKVEESLELLMQGVERHPSFTVARVVLARELLAKGMVGQAWQTLEDSPLSLEDNVLAQRLRLKLAILLSDDERAREIYQLLQMHQMQDDESVLLGEFLDQGSLEKAQQHLLAELKAQGVNPILPDPEPIVDESTPQVEPTVLGSPIAADDSAISRRDEDHLQNFHVVPLNEVFRGVSTDIGIPQFSPGIELDSTTLADLYCKQGHYGKAVSVYRRLLKMSPNNDYLRRKLKEVMTMEKQQKDEDLTVDPSVIDQMEAIEIIKAQSKLFDDLLQRIEQRQKF